MDHEELVDALWSDQPCSEYATGGEVDASAYPMPTSIQVEGAGDLALPLSHNDFVKLKAVSTQAPYGRGEQTLLDTDVRRAWQVQASKVTCPQVPEFFSKVVLDLAVPAMTELGIDVHALGLEVRLYKLLVYEQGGHFKFHRDTEKEVGMFATMILQLPTQSGHEGGQLEVRQKKKRRTFDFSGDGSMTGYFKTVFFCDCEHRLAEVKSGTRMCLVFSLIRNNVTFMDVDATRYIGALGRVQTLMKEWADDEGAVLAVPLGHKYSNNSLSFAGLKGYDRVVATLLLSCTNFLDVHLCMLEKVVITNSVFDTHEEMLQVRNWSAVDGKAKHFTSCQFDTANIVSYGNLFDDEGPPDNETHEPYTGNDGGDTNSSYYAAVLVVWPKERRMQVLAELQPVENVLSFLEEQHEQEPQKTMGDLQSVIARSSFDSYDEPYQEPYQDLLKFCLRHDLQEAAFMVLKEWISMFLSSAETMITAIQKYGWDVCYREVIQGALDEAGLIGDSPEITSLPMRLRNNGLEDAAMCVAKQLLNRGDLAGHSVNKLVEFFAISGLEDETWQLWDRLSATFDTHCVALVAKTWSEKGIPRVQELLEKRLKDKEKSWEETAEANWRNSKFGGYGGYFGHGGHKLPEDRRKIEQELKKLQRRGRKKFLEEIAELVLELEAQGGRDAALALANKDFLNGVSLEELYDGVDNAMDAMVLLLRFGDKFHDKIRNMTSGWKVMKLLKRMREAADLFGLKKDAKVTQLFTELLSKQVLSIEGMDELLDLVFWVGDEKLIADIVKRAECMKQMFPAMSEEGKLKILARAKEWDVAGKNGFRELVNARIRYFSQASDDEDEEMKSSEEDEDGEDEESDHDTRSKRRKLDPRMQRVEEDERKERTSPELEWLHGLLADMSALDG